MPRTKEHHIVHEGDCPNNCGFASTNRRHYESFWEDRADPRFKDDKYFRFNNHYYAALDRQIAENHHTDCLGNAPAAPGVNGQGQVQASSSEASTSTTSTKK